MRDGTRPSNVYKLRPAAMRNPIAEAADRLTRFNRLREAFRSVGWDLFPLHGEAILAANVQMGVDRVCRSFGEAERFLEGVRQAC